MGKSTPLIDFNQLIADNTQPYFNTVISTVNDHVVRLGIMTSAYPWHRHPNSDETFIGVEGVVLIETEETTFELHPGSTVTIPMNMLHRTLPQGSRSVNLTVEKADMQTVFEG